MEYITRSQKDNPEFHTKGCELLPLGQGETCGAYQDS